MLTASEHVNARRNALSNGADAVVQDRQSTPLPNPDLVEHVAQPDARVSVLIENVIRNSASSVKLVVCGFVCQSFFTPSDFTRSER
jgi:hypothetical protein